MHAHATRTQPFPLPSTLLVCEAGKVGDHCHTLSFVELELFFPLKISIQIKMYSFTIHFLSGTGIIFSIEDQHLDKELQL